MLLHLRVLLLVAHLLALFAGFARAKDEGPLAVEALPSPPEQWLNYPPISLDRLEGKGLVLLFFDASCPKCAAKWPDLLQLSKQHQLSPVVFIAVNSGNPPAAVAAYLRQHQITWPVIVDADRMFERAVLGKRITLQESMAVRIRKPDGKWQERSPRQMAKAAVAASKGGRWHVDPNTMPLELRQAWGHIELGHFSASLPMLVKARRRGSEDVKLAAEVLQATVEMALNTERTAIDELLSAGDDWQAYQSIGSLLSAYDGFDLAPELVVRLQSLSKSEVVLAELAAAKRLKQALHAGSAGTPNAIKRATRMLERIVAEHAATEAGEKAARLLEGVSSRGGTVPQ